MILKLTEWLHRVIRPACPKGTLRGHIWFGIDRFLQTWRNRGLWRAFHSVWAKRVRPLYVPHSEVPDNRFYSRHIRTHDQRITPHTRTVDIIVCVHNALDDVKTCLTSVIRYTRPPYRLIVVDDGSDAETRDHLQTWAIKQNATLIRHDAAKGYTLAANAGLRASTADYALLLNSDTIVTPLWLDRLVACAESHERIGLVGPLSNAASWQSVPEIFDEKKDWFENPLPPGFTLNEWSLCIGRHAGLTYPTMPFLNGFCILIKRAVLNEVGVFDEKNFARGYGEENDFAVRARNAGWGLALADDAFVWHAQSKSYSHERRLILAAAAQDTLNALHGEETFTAGCGYLLADRTLQGIRARIRALPQRAALINEGRRRHEAKRVLFILPTARPGGGSHVIIQEARAMQQMGVDVRLFNFTANKKDFHAAYPENTVPVLYGRDLNDLTQILPDFDAVMATLFSSVAWIDPAKTGASNTVRGYYIQDYEPWFFTEGTPDRDEAEASYALIPDMVRVTKTAWNRQVVQKETGQDCVVIGSSVDTELFMPRPSAQPHDKINILAMIRPETERRNPAMTLRVLETIAKRYPDRVAITLFGCEPDAPLCKAAAKRFPFQHLGIVTRTALAELLPTMDIFADFSSYQAMGLTALEAMACGVGVILPQNGGSDAFAKHGENAWIIDTDHESACVEALEHLIQSPELLTNIRQQAITDVCAFAPEQAALNILNALFPQEVSS